MVSPALSCRHPTGAQSAPSGSQGLSPARGELLRRSAREEFEVARHERDPELVWPVLACVMAGDAAPWVALLTRLAVMLTRRSPVC